MKRYLVLLTLSVLTGGCGNSMTPVDTTPPEETHESTAAVEPSATVLSEIPETVDPSAHYLIYLHGGIVEEQGMHPIHPRFGSYDYAGILKAFADRGFVVISEARPRGTRPDVFTEHVAEQVHTLLDRGVPEEHITVVGFSKGGVIALLASAQVGRDDVNWVIQAGCGRWIERMPDFVPAGHILSQIDRADDIAANCQEAAARMADRTSFTETELDVGEGHGTFYTVRPEWFEPAVEWGGL